MSVAITNNVRTLFEDDEDRVSDSMVDLLTILLLVFLLIIFKLALTGFKIQFLSKDNTYSGGIIRPSFFLTPVKFNNKDIITIHKQDRDNIDCDEVLLGIEANDFAGLLSFIDPGEIYVNGIKKAILHFKFKEEKYFSGKSFIINFDEGSGVAILDNAILHNIISSVWDDYKFSDFSSMVFKDDFDIKRRPAVYYESFIINEKKYIIIGDFFIDITDGLSYQHEFIFNNLATAIMDFVYLGDFSPEKRVDFFREYDGEKGVDYYYQWNNSKKTKETEINTMVAPFVKYKNYSKEYIKHYANENIEPPLWVREVFLDKIGANLKVVGEDIEGRLVQ